KSWGDGMKVGEGPGDPRSVTLDVLIVAFLLFLPAAHFLYQEKGECHFLNGTQQVRLLLRSFYNRQEIDYFDSDLGKYVAVTPLGQPDVDKWNRDEVYLQYWKAQVDSVCRHNYRLYSYKAPTVTISPTKMDPASPNTILLCTARGFYPLEIEVRWLKNGQLEEEGVAFGEELQNGDWTYQLQVILETQPQWGDVYTCQVEHASLEAPITVQWGKPLPSCPEKGERRFLAMAATHHLAATSPQNPPGAQPSHKIQKDSSQNS
uniref:Ig-like domain-containing protein n=1 Tax=Naja naja TaxID=35670 RepID=A0A8C6X0W9_NAJNA